MNKYAHLENYVSELRKTAGLFETKEETLARLAADPNNPPLTGSDYAQYVNAFNESMKANGLALAGIGGGLAASGIATYAADRLGIPDSTAVYATVAPVVAGLGYGTYKGVQSALIDRHRDTLDPEILALKQKHPIGYQALALTNFMPSYRMSTPTAQKLVALSSPWQRLRGAVPIVEE